MDVGAGGEARLKGWKRDLASPELALVDALFPWAKPDSGRGFLGRWKWCSGAAAGDTQPNQMAGRHVRILVSDRDGDQPS